VLVRPVPSDSSGSRGAQSPRVVSRVFCSGFFGSRRPLGCSFQTSTRFSRNASCGVGHLADAAWFHLASVVNSRRSAYGWSRAGIGRSYGWCLITIRIGYGEVNLTARSRSDGVSRLSGPGGGFQSHQSPVGSE